MVKPRNSIVMSLSLHITDIHRFLTHGIQPASSKLGTIQNNIRFLMVHALPQILGRIGILRLPLIANLWLS